MLFECTGLKKKLRVTGKNLTQLRIQLPHQLNRKVGESVSVVLDGKEFRNVSFANGVYKIAVPIVNFPDPMLIIISRGSYKMNSTFIFTSPFEHALIWILVMISPLIILGFIVLLICRNQTKINKEEGKRQKEEKDVKDKDQSKKRHGTDEEEGKKV